jgi:hypothetical protein
MQRSPHDRAEAGRLRRSVRPVSGSSRSDFDNQNDEAALGQFGFFPNAPISLRYSASASP